MKLSRSQTLWTLWLVGAVLSGALLGLYQYVGYQALRAQAFTHLQALSSAKQLALQIQLGHVTTSLRQAVAVASSASPPSPSWNADTTNGLLDGIVQANPAVITLMVVNANGMSVASNRPTLIGINFRNSPRYKAISEHPDPRKVYISEPFLTPLGNYTIAVGALLAKPDGGFGGYVLAIAAPAFFSDILGSGTSAYDVTSTLIHEDGLVIFRVPSGDDRDPSLLRVSADSPFWAFLKSGAAEFHTAIAAPRYGPPSLVTYRRLALPDSMTDHALVLGLNIDANTLYEDWQTSGLQWFALWVLLVGLGGLYVAWTTQRYDV